MNLPLFRCVALGGLLLALSTALGEVHPTDPDPDYPVVLKEPEDPGPVSVEIENSGDMKGMMLVKVKPTRIDDVETYLGAVQAQAVQGTIVYTVTKLTQHGTYYRGKIEAPCGTDPASYPSFSIRVAVDYKGTDFKTAVFKSFKGVAVP